MNHPNGKIVVTGAAGKTGQAVLRALKRRQVRARALIHRAEREEVVRKAGADEVMVGDLRNANDMTRALAGAGALYHICPNVSPDEIDIGRNVIQAAKDSGVQRFVFHSVLHPQTEAMPHHWRKLRVEELIYESGLPATILQPAAYMQNLLTQMPAAESEGVFSVPYPVSTRLSLVDLEDVAQAAAKVLTEPGHVGATYELCGPEAPDQNEVAAILGEALGRPVRAIEIPLESWRQDARAGGLDDQRCDTLVAMFRYYAHHGFVGNANVLRWLLGREPTSLRNMIG